MTKTKERNILLLLRAAANALQENTRLENVPWALKVPILFRVYWELAYSLCKQLFTLSEPIPSELFTSSHRIVATTLLVKYVDFSPTVMSCSRVT